MDESKEATQSISRSIDGRLYFLGNGINPVVDNDPRGNMVLRLMSLHDQYEPIARESFENNPLFQRSLKRASEHFINSDENVARLLAEYAHEVLKKGSKTNPEEMSIDKVLTNFSSLYFYLTDKVIFEQMYQTKLHYRLLHDDFENEHSEKSMIQKIKHGNFQFTNKLEGMFLNTFRELTERFMKSPAASVLRLREGKMALEGMRSPSSIEGNTKAIIWIGAWRKAPPRSRLSSTRPPLASLSCQLIK